MKKTNAVLKIHLGKRVFLPFFLFGFLLLCSASMNAQSYVPFQKGVEIVDNYKKDFYQANPELSARVAVLPASTLNAQIKSEYLETLGKNIIEAKAEGVGFALTATTNYMIDERGHDAQYINALQQELDQLLRL